MTDTALTPDEQARFTALYGTAPAQAEPDSPGLFDGAYKGLAGIPAGLAGTPLSVASAATAMPDVFHSSILGQGYVNDFNLDGDQLAQLEKDSKDYFSTTWQYGVHKAIEDTRQSAADYYRPDPQTTGFVGNTLFGATDVLTRVGLGNLVAPGSGLALAAGTTGYERTQDLEAQGVDAQTAQASGALTGVSLLAGGGISALGKTVTAKAVSGALLNAGFGAGTRALDSAILDAHGYTAQAEQQRWSDGASIAADLIIGGAFHLLPSRGKEAPAKPSSDTVDAALTAKAAQGVTDSAPGVPADPKSASAHAAALDTAQAQLVDGKAVDVEPMVREATFAPRPEHSIPITDLPAFRKWFDGSAVTREDGVPLTVYHGTGHSFDVFKKGEGRGAGGYSATMGYFFTSSPEVASSYAQQAVEFERTRGYEKSMQLERRGQYEEARALDRRLDAPDFTGDMTPNVIPAYLSIKNPKIVNFDGRSYDSGRDNLSAIISEAQAAGHDGVILRNLDDAPIDGFDPADHFVVFEPWQIKSAIGNNGEFDPNNPSFTDAKAHEAHQVVREAFVEAGVPDDVLARLDEPVHAPVVESADALEPAPTTTEPAARTIGERVRDLLGRSKTNPDAQTGAGAVRADGGVGAAQPRNSAADGAPDDGTRLDPARDGDVALARQIAQETPDLVLDDGTTAADALRAADLDVQEAQRQAEGIGAAVACFLRFGADA